MNKKLKFVEILKNGLQIGIKNAVPLIGASILWALTCWIPYLNVGTTIAMFFGLPTAMGKGNAVSPMEIFNAKYRKQMGEFFLVTAFMGVGIYIGFAFGGIPGYVILFTWMLAPFLVLDKGVNPIEALQQSNDLMVGNKWQVFFATLVLGLVIYFPILIAFLIAGLIGHWSVMILAFLFAMVLAIVGMASGIGIQAYIYSQLVAEE